MAEQFPNDDSGGENDAVVYLWAATLKPNESAEFAKRMTAQMRDDASKLPGFLEGRVLEADDGATVFVITNWESRHAWADAQWNQKIGRALAASFESAVAIVDNMCYERAVVKPHST